MKLSVKKRYRNILSAILSVSVLLGAFQGKNVCADNSAGTKPVLSYEGERTMSFNDGWAFCLEPSGSPEEVGYDDSEWLDVTLPYDWSIYRDFESPIGSGVGSLRGGNGWYRKSFVLPQNLSGKRINIDFDGVYQDSSIYVNGQPVGNYPNGYVPFSFDITGYVICDGKTENVIAVSVTNVTDEKNSGYTSRWYSGSGIYRDVYMTVTEPLHVEKYGVVVTTPDLEYEYPSGKVTVDLSTNIVNETESAAQISVRNTVMNYYGVLPYSGAEPAVSGVQTVEAGDTLSVSQ
ncbi:MAG: beta galactosidase jelly roll domain-containing protein [Lachnospiraceae bacterium]|nr:beta galactosidase jelly roll domain-containing protein [Lachnospiraceae bacterium]